MLIQVVLLWSHSLAALLFGLLAFGALQRGRWGLPRRMLSAALLLTGFWALAMAGIGPGEMATRMAEGMRNLGWLTFLLVALWRLTGRVPPTLVAVHAMVWLTVALSLILFLASEAAPTQPAADLFEGAAMLLRLMAILAALVLLHHVYGLLRDAGARMLLLALAALWTVDANVFVAQLVTGDPALELQAARGLAVSLIAGAMAVALTRRDDWEMRVSRKVTLQSLSVLGAIAYLVMLVAGTGLLATFGGVHARVYQAAFVIGANAALITLLSSPWLRAWIKVKLAKHLFRHRYDYRSEWLRFTDTLGGPNPGATLEQRGIKAIADLVQSPAGLLLMAEGTGLGLGPGWNWESEILPAQTPMEGLGEFLNQSGRVIELDSVRGGRAGQADIIATPAWMLNLSQAWAIVPLPHLDRLAGAILLARPPIDRALDWEDFDLLKVAGRQVASYLAEARATAALMEAERFEEFNRRFAFILHDLKNLVSQLTLVARNAERHADNPAFRADMVATLQDSAARMNDLLARLSVRGRMRAEIPMPVAVAPLVERIVNARRHQHPVEAIVMTRPKAMADPARLEQILTHLIQNAIEASAPDSSVAVFVDQDGGRVLIDVVDRGCGMTPAFIRDELFRPFASTKPDGFGVGAYEARSLAEAMGGAIEVTSRPGEGSRFRLILQAAHYDKHEMEQAA